jgi:hypothetical protein
MVPTDNHLAQIELWILSQLYFFEAYQAEFEFEFTEGGAADFSISFDGSAVSSLRFHADGTARLFHRNRSETEDARATISIVPIGTFDPAERIDCQFQFDQKLGTASLSINGEEFTASDLFGGVGETWGTALLNFQSAAVLQNVRIKVDSDEGAGVLLHHFNLKGLGFSTPRVAFNYFEAENETDYVKIPLVPPANGDWIVQYSRDLDTWETFTGVIRDNSPFKYAIILPISQSDCGWVRVKPLPLD